jgi:integrase
MPVYFDKARKRWRYEFDRIVDGRRQRARKLLPRGWTAAQAESYARAQDARLYAAATGAQQDEPLIAEAVLVYLQERVPQLKSATKIEADLALCAAWYEGRRMSELADVVSEYQEDAAGLAPGTVRNRMAYLRSACRWAWRHKRMGQHDPAERVAMPQVRNERHAYIDRKQVLQLARSIPDLDQRACVLVAFYSGMRLGEVLRAKPTKRGWLLTDTKNGERRLVPIHRRVAHLAKRWPRKVAASTLQKTFRRVADSLGMTWLRFHDLRHSTASALIEAGVDLYTVGGVLGHKTPASTARYAHLAISKLERAIGSM